MILLAAAIAVSAIDLVKAKPLEPHAIIISVSKSEDVVITMDGKPITCPELDAYLATIDKNRHLIGFDCKKLKFKTTR